MRWRGREGSGNVEDRRGMGGKVAIGGGLGGIIVLVLSLLFGNNFSSDDVDISNDVPNEQGTYTPTEEEKEDSQFVSVVLKDTEDVWHQLLQEMKDILEPGDIGEALNAANAIGDDRLQRQAQGYVVPDAFTHGTSKQRMYWFKKGFDTGDIEEGDTFEEIQ